jgi:hypothetical protein
MNQLNSSAVQYASIVEPGFVDFTLWIKDGISFACRDAWPIIFKIDCLFVCLTDSNSNIISTVFDSIAKQVLADMPDTVRVRADRDVVFHLQRGRGRSNQLPALTDCIHEVDRFHLAYVLAVTGERQRVLNDFFHPAQCTRSGSICSLSHSGQGVLLGLVRRSAGSVNRVR